MFNKALQNKKDIFLLDGLGALISAFLLGIVLVYFEDIFGIPKQTLYVLALFPCLFLVYDLVCFYFINQNLSFHLKGIAILNLFYILLSITLIYKDAASISWLGFTYIIVEIIILIILISFEWKFSSKL